MIPDLWLSVVARFFGWLWQVQPDVPDSWFASIGGLAQNISQLVEGGGPLLFFIDSGTLQAAFAIVVAGLGAGMVIRLVRLLVNVATTAGVPVDA